MLRWNSVLLCVLPFATALWPSWHQAMARSRGTSVGSTSRSLAVLRSLPVPAEDDGAKVEAEIMMKAVYTCNVCETRNMVEVGYFQFCLEF
jgi:hypothetical protein